MTANRLPVLEIIPFIKPSYFETAIWKLPSEKNLLHIPLAQGLQSQCLTQKATPLLPSLLRLPLPHADSYKTHEVLNIPSLSPKEIEPNSRWVSLQWSSATTSLIQG